MPDALRLLPPPHPSPLRRYVSLLLLLFLIPGIIMMTAYGLISLELYRGIRLELSSRKSNRGRKSKSRLTAPWGWGG